jgi:hypothetical protein
MDQGGMEHQLVVVLMISVAPAQTSQDCAVLLAIASAAPIFRPMRIAAQMEPRVVLGVAVILVKSAVRVVPMLWESAALQTRVNAVLGNLG